MSQVAETSDRTVLHLLRDGGPLSISQLMDALGVTGTAVRQRLTRLTKQGMIERRTVQGARGRPGHRYALTEKGRRQAGSNFDDLAMVLWKELRSVQDPEVRRGLLQRVAGALRSMYADQVQGATTSARMESLTHLMSDRGLAAVVETNGELPVLTMRACPYPQLAEQDRSICAMENMLLSDLVGERIRLTDYRLEGATCCRFTPA